MNTVKDGAKRDFDVIVIGGGPGGYTAALYTVRAGLSTLVLEKQAAGGQMALTNWIDNYPGFEDGVGGFELGMKMQAGAERFSAVTRFEKVVSVDLRGETKTVSTEQGVFRAKAVIIAAGADHRRLGVSGEAELAGKGVSYCASCDGMFFRGKTVAVVGGGNSAAADAMALSRIAKKVFVICRRDTLRATRVYHAPLMSAGNVEFKWNSVVTRLLHGDRLTGVGIRDVKSGEESQLELDGIFISIGRAPATDMFRGQLELDGQGYIVAGESTETGVPGVYAVGDVRTKSVRQIVTATADGAAASHFAEEYLAGRA